MEKNMYKYRTLTTLVLLFAAAGLSACASDRSAYDPDYGQSVRTMISRQTHDPLALLGGPSTSTDQDGQKAEAVLEAYRGQIGNADSIKQSDPATIGFDR